METDRRPLPAATVVIARPTDSGFEILLQRRATNLAFMGGIWVFPGGRIDDADRSDATVDELDVARACARREALEESGVDLSSASSSHGPCELLPFARWVTPAIERRRYDTLFFITAVAAETEAVEDGTEATETLWITPERALRQSHNSQLPLSPPTLITLLDLCRISHIDQINDWAAGRDLRPIEPHATLTEAGPTIAFPGDPLLGRPTESGRPTRCVLLDGRWVLTSA